MDHIVKFSKIIALSILLSGGLTACGGGLFNRDKPQTDLEILQGQEGRILWEAGLQYVKIVDRDVPGLANEHPAAISSEELRTVLSSLYVTERIGLKKSQNPLFSAGELQVLSTALASGLSQAQANEDINFVGIGSHPGLIATERKTTTGRVFISGGRLNIIFGLIHEIYKEKDPITNQPIDRRIDPLLPGTRKFDSKPTTRVAIDKGQSYYIDPKTNEERSDWLIIDIATVLAEANKQKGQNDGTVSAELLEDIARSKRETVNLRDDVSSIKEILFELSDEIADLKQQIKEIKGNP